MPTIRAIARRQFSNEYPTKNARASQTPPKEITPPPDWDMYERMEKMRSRKIRIKHGPYILRWGHTPLGIFTVFEAYNLKIRAHPLNKDLV